MNQVFVLGEASSYCHDGAAAIGNLENIDTLADGSPAFFQIDSVKVLDNGTFTKSNDLVTMFMGNAGTIIKSSVINTATLEYKKQVYIAPAPKTIILTDLNLNATNKMGSEYGIAFVDLEKDVNERRKYEVTLTTVTDNVAYEDIVDDLISAVEHNDTIMSFINRIVKDAGSSSILVEGNPGKNFAIYGVGLLENADLIHDGFFNVGANTYEWAKVLEYDESTLEGRSNALAPAVDDGYKLAPRVKMGQNYTVYNLKYEWLREGYPSPNANPTTKEITILVPGANVTLIASLDNVLNSLTSV